MELPTHTHTNRVPLSHTQQLHLESSLTSITSWTSIIAMSNRLYSMELPVELWLLILCLLATTDIAAFGSCCVQFNTVFAMNTSAILRGLLSHDDIQIISARHDPLQSVSSPAFLIRCLDRCQIVEALSQAIGTHYVEKDVVMRKALAKHWLLILCLLTPTDMATFRSCSVTFNTILSGHASTIPNRLFGPDVLQAFYALYHPLQPISSPAYLLRYLDRHQNFEILSQTIGSHWRTSSRMFLPWGHFFEEYRSGLASHVNSALHRGYNPEFADRLGVPGPPGILQPRDQATHLPYLRHSKSDYRSESVPCLRSTLRHLHLWRP